MDGSTFLQRLASLGFFQAQINHVEVIEPREAVGRETADPLDPRVRHALAGRGITALYSHQAAAIDAVRAGNSVVVVTSTASGKTLCYHVPAVETVLAEPRATALFLYPTKALAQDQLRGLGRLLEDTGASGSLAGTYDGDTPGNLRRKLRDAGNFILTNPDMLHQGILPNHARWNRFFTHLRYVVIDEIHAYRGVFGSHLANVLRRLDRVCAHYGSTPLYVCSSATIDNPREHAESVTGRSMELVADDGSPRGPKRFVIWNPPPLQASTAAAGGNEDAGGDRRSPLWEAVHLMTALVREGIQVIAFTRTRLAAELLYRNCRELLSPESRRLADSIRAYRGGYLPEERREIERQLVEREILGVASTNALELGIDIGSLDAAILVGYPGSIASLWQQAGRAGRGAEESVVFLVGQNSPIDQYLMSHSGYLFDRNPEQAVIDPDNPHIVVDHVRCAAHELPIADEEIALFGTCAQPIVEILEEDEEIRHIDDRWYWARSEYPAAGVNLRNIAGAVYTIQDEAEGEKVIGTLDEVSAFSQLHDHAVYLHGADTYFVNRLDIEQKIAHVERRDLDYYTQAVTASQIRVDQVDATDAIPGADLGFGDVTATTSIPMFKKIRFHSRDSLGFEQLELPPQSLETVATWLAPDDAVCERMRGAKMVVGEGLIGIGNVVVEIARIFVMCDPQDIGAVVDANCLGRDALFIYDRYPGGMGFASRCRDQMPRVLQTARTVIAECLCDDGCPSCVGAALPAFALTDLDSAVRDRVPDKRAALFLLEQLAPAVPTDETPKC